MAPLEGALLVRADGGRFVLETVDYGQAFRLLDAGSEREIKEAVIGALDGVHTYPIGTPSSTDPSRRRRCAPRTTCTSS